MYLKKLNSDNRMLEVLIKDKGEKSVLKIVLGYVNTLLLMNHVLLLKSKKER